MGRPNAAQRVCPLCEARPANTDEDVVPLWTARLLKRLLPPISVNLPPRVLVRLCSPCNADLNRVFEIPAKPVVERLISGDRLVMNEPEQILAAAWMAKTALVGLIGGREYLEHAKSPVARAIQAALSNMVLTGYPPSDASVRIAPMSIGSQFFTKIIPEVPTAARTLSIARGVSFIGHICWEAVLYPPGAGGDHLDDDASFVRIWPVQFKERRWPTGQVIDHDLLQRMREAWGDHSQAKPDASWRMNVPKPREPGQLPIRLPGHGWAALLPPDSEAPEPPQSIQ